jgi:hypothetical protein
LSADAGAAAVAAKAIPTAAAEAALRIAFIGSLNKSVDLITQSYRAGGKGVRRVAPLPITPAHTAQRLTHRVGRVTFSSNLDHISGITVDTAP